MWVCSVAYHAHSLLSAGLSAQGSSSANYGVVCWVWVVFLIMFRIRCEWTVWNTQFRSHWSLCSNEYFLKSECNFQISIYSEIFRPNEPDKFWENSPTIHEWTFWGIKVLIQWFLVLIRDCFHPKVIHAGKNQCSQKFQAQCLQYTLNMA